MPRLFFALWPDDATRAALAAAARGVVLRDGRRTPDDNLHLTLHFLGEVADARLPDLLAAAVAITAAPVALELTQVGWWRRSRVAWLGMPAAPTALLDLVAAVRAASAAAGWEGDLRDFNAHVTVARQVRRPPGVAAPFRVPWMTDSFALMASRGGAAGVRYEVLASMPLSAAPTGAGQASGGIGGSPAEEAISH